MKFIANENIPLEVVQRLQKEGLEFMRIDEVQKGMSDEKVTELAQKIGGVLITFDKDFGELVFKKRKKVDGIILLRIKPRSIDYVIDRIQKLLISGIELKGKFIIIEDDKIRVREIKSMEVQND